MNTHTDKTQENKSLPVANEMSKKQSSTASTFQFSDNRPETIVQRKLQKMANKSPQVKLTPVIQLMQTDKFNKQKKERIGQALSEHAAQVQWEGLGMNINSHGHHKNSLFPNKTHFICTISTALGYAQLTLSKPDQVFSKDGTRLVFIKQFGEQIGVDGNEKRYNMCVVVELAALSQDIDPFIAEEDIPVGAEFVTAYPCK